MVKTTGTDLEALGIVSTSCDSFRRWYGM